MTDSKNNAQGSKNSVADLDELYYLAQMLANNITDVNTLVEKAVMLRHEGSELPNVALLRAVRPSDEGIAGSADLMKIRQLEVDLGYIVPRLLTKTAPERRVNIVQAFGSSFSDPVERSAFMHRIRRALETHSDPAFAELVTENHVGKSIRRFIESTFSPTPPSLRGILESKYGPNESDSSVVNAPQSRKNSRSLPFQIAAGFVLILLASAIATWIAKPARVAEAPEGRLEILNQIDQLEPTNTFVFQGSDRSQIERLIEERTGQRVHIPMLEDGEIKGLSLVELAADFTLPVVHFTQQGKDTPLYVLDYRSIQNVYDTLAFDPSVLNQIASPNGLDIHVMESRSRIVFRHRDDIYITFAEENPMEFRGHFIFDE